MANGQHTGQQIKRKGNQGSYVLGEKLGEGAEGVIYSVANSPQWAVKVYKPGKAPKDVQAQKLLAMEGLMPPLSGERTGHPSLAWPEQIIQDQNRDLVGFVMPRVDTARTMKAGHFFIPNERQQKLLEMNAPSDSQHIQNTTWKIIRNLSKIMARVHEQGHLIGDINERNIFVEPQHGDVSIMDCDSFQIRDAKNRVIYRCKMGRPEYTAPELLRQMKGHCTNRSCPNWPSEHPMEYLCVEREQKHDRFGLAVIIFQLLMDGGHPYDCRIDESHNVEDNSLKEKIIKGYYPYSRSKPPYIHINNKNNERRFANIPEDAKKRFEQAFVPA